MILAAKQLTYAGSGITGITGIRDGDFEQAVRNLLEDPPAWLTYALHAYLSGKAATVRRTGPKVGKPKEYRAKFRLENVCATVAGHVCGDASRWREAEPVVRTWLDEHGDEIGAMEPPQPVGVGEDKKKLAKPPHRPKDPPPDGILTVELAYQEMTRFASRAFYERDRYHDEPNPATWGRLVRAVLSDVGLEDADWLDYAGVVKAATERLIFPVLQAIIEWRDPNSNRGHHDFQSYTEAFRLR
jgi:hypothetical protein